MAFRLGAVGAANSGTRRGTGGHSSTGTSSGSVGSMFSSLQKKASSAAESAAKAAKQGVQEAKKAINSAQQGSSAKTQEQPVADSQAVDQLVSMGFNRIQAAQALTQVGGVDVEAAAALLCGEFGNEFRPVRPFAAGDWVEVHGLQSVAGQALNGHTGQVVEYDESKERYTVEVDGVRNSVRPENLKAAPTSGQVQAQMKASLKAAQASATDARRRAEKILSKTFSSKESDASTPLTESHASNAPTGTSAGSTAPADPETMAAQRRANAEAAERRLAEARARNAGTMDDYRRQQREQAQQRLAQNRQRQEASSLPRSGLVASSLEEDPSALTIGQSEETQEEDPQLTELMLQQAQAEEELELQKALSLSIESERAFLEQRRVDQACTGADRDEAGMPVSGACCAADTEEETARQVDIRKDQEAKLREEQSLMEARVEELRAQVSQYEVTQEDLELQHAINQSIENERALVAEQQKERQLSYDSTVSAEAAGEQKAALPFSPQPRTVSQETGDQAEVAAKEAAATRIQSAHRGSLVRKQQSASTQTKVEATEIAADRDGSDNVADASQADAAAMEAAAIRIQSARRGSLVRRQQSASTQTQVTSAETPDDKTVVDDAADAAKADAAAKEAAATRIQSAHRGSLVRREQSASAEVKAASTTEAAPDKADAAAQEAAAIRIQSMRRGSLVRRQQSASTQTQATADAAVAPQTDVATTNAEEF